MIIMWIGLAFLLFFCLLDLKYQRIANGFIFGMGCVGIISAIARADLVPTLLGMALMGILGWWLWKKDMLGGADVKVLIVVVPFLSFHRLPNMLVTVMLFFISFGILASIYGAFYKMLFKKKDVLIPLLPILTLAYCISWYMRFG